MAYYYRAVAHLNMGKTDLTLEDLNDSLEENPSYFLAQFQRAEVYFFMRRYDEALAEYDKIIHAQPKNGFAYYRRSLICQAKGDKSKALENALEAKTLGYPIDDQYVASLKKG